MTNVSMINYSTRDFATKEQLELYLLRQEKSLYTGDHKTIHRRWYVAKSGNTNMEQRAIASSWHHFRIPGSRGLHQMSKAPRGALPPSGRGLNN